MRCHGRGGLCIHERGVRCCTSVFAAFNMAPSAGIKGCAMLAPFRGKQADCGATVHSRALCCGVESDFEEGRVPLAGLHRKAGASRAHRIHTVPRTHTIVPSFSQANALRGVVRL